MKAAGIAQLGLEAGLGSRLCLKATKNHVETVPIQGGMDVTFLQPGWAYEMRFFFAVSLGVEAAQKEREDALVVVNRSQCKGIPWRRQTFVKSASPMSKSKKASTTSPILLSSAPWDYMILRSMTVAWTG